MHRLGNTNKPAGFQAGSRWEVPLLTADMGNGASAFSSDTCPCTQRKGLQGGLLTDVVSELALREVRGPLPPALPRRVVTCWDTQCLEGFSALPSPTSTRKFLQLPPSLLLRRWPWWDRGRAGSMLATEKLWLRVVRRARCTCSRERMKDLFSSVSSPEVSQLIN